MNEQVEQAYWNGFATKCAEMGADPEAVVKQAQSRPNMLLAGPAVGGALGLAGGAVASPVAALLAAQQKAKSERAKGSEGRPVSKSLVAALRALITTPLQGAALGGATGLGIGGLLEGGAAANRYLSKQSRYAGSRSES